MTRTVKKVVVDPNDPNRKIVKEVEESLPIYTPEPMDYIDIAYSPTSNVRESFTRDKISRFINNGLLIRDMSRVHVKGDFNCSNLGLKSLIGMPKKVQGTFDCSGNELENLEGLPVSCHTIKVSNNPIRTLKHLDDGQKREYGSFICNETRLANLIGLKNVKINLLNLGRGNNFLNSFEGVPPGIISKQINFPINNTRQAAQAEWYYSYGYNKMYKNYWEEIRDDFLEEGNYVLLDSIVFWPEGVMSEEMKKEIKTRTDNYNKSSNSVNKFNL